MKSRYELVIVGGGPAGLTAAIYSTRRKVDTLLLAKVIGGQAAWSSDIDNYLGFSMITGPELIAQFYRHVKRFDDDNATFDLEVQEGAEATGLVRHGNAWSVALSDGQTVEARAIIIAAGKVPRRLNIPGEAKLVGRGVTFCATCDAPLYKGKVVAVVGGGNSALDAAWQLRKVCPQVYLVTVNAELQGEQVMIEAVAQSPNVTVLTECDALEVLGSDQVTALRLKDRRTGGERELTVGGIFEEIGYEPATGFLRGVVELNSSHEVVINALNETSAPGIFAAGDITTVPAKQIIVAAGEGAKAALQAYAYLTRPPSA